MKLPKSEHLEPKEYKELEDGYVSYRKAYCEAERERIKSEKRFERARQLLLRVLEMEGDLYQTNLGGAIREYVAETQDSRIKGV